MTPPLRLQSWLFRDCFFFCPFCTTFLLPLRCKRSQIGNYSINHCLILKNHTMILKNQTMIYKNQTMILRIIAYLTAFTLQWGKFFCIVWARFGSSVGA